MVQHRWRYLTVALGVAILSMMIAAAPSLAAASQDGTPVPSLAGDRAMLAVGDSARDVATPVPSPRPSAPGAGASATPAASSPAAGSGVAVPIFDPGAIARGVLASLDWTGLLTAILKAIWSVLFGNGFEQLGGDLARLLVKNPNLLAEYGGMRNVQQVVDAFRYAAIFACLALFAATVIQLMAGTHEAPQAALGRLVAVVAALGFYKVLVDWALRASEALAEGVLTAGADTTTGLFTGLLKALLPAALPLWYFLSLIGGFLLIAVFVVKFIGFAFVLLAYAAGPLVLPLAVHPRTAGWVGVWAEHLAKALLWPTLWALEFRIFGALSGGLTLVGPAGDVALGTAAANALLALAMLVLMAYTPWLLHTRFTLARGAQVLVQQAVRLADTATVVVTGGAAGSVKGALAARVASRQANPPAENGD